MLDWFHVRRSTVSLCSIVLCAVVSAQPTDPPAPPAPQAPAYVLPDGYPTADQVRQHLYDAAKANPDLCEAVDLTERYNTPETHEGRHLYALRISAGHSDNTKPAVLFVAAHHGDEVTTVVTALQGIDILLEGYATDPAISKLLDTREVWIAPLWNPDGYSNGTRLNARTNDNGTIGVDLNRNYPFGFGECGGADNPGASTYQGASPASEPETQTMLAFASDRRFIIVHDAHAGAFDLRTGYGCEQVHPWREFMTLQATEIIETAQLNFDQGSSCCLAGNIHTQMATNLANAFLWELGNKQQLVQEARDQANKVWQGIIQNLAQPISLSGQTQDAATGLPLETTITLPDAGFQNSESATTSEPGARFNLILPPGPQTIEFAAPGYETTRIEVTIEPNTELTRTVTLTPLAPIPTENAKPN